MKKTLLLFAILLNIIAVDAQRQPYDKDIIIEKDISTMSANDSVIFQIFYTSEMALDVEGVAITGTANGTIDICVTNDTTKTSTPISHSLLPYTISSANFIQAFEKSTLPFYYLVVRIKKNNMTGGILRFNLVNKRRFDR
jgi:hypothetical protein